MGELSIRPSAAHRFGVSRARAAALTARAAALHGAARGCGAARWHCCVVGARRRATGDGRVLENMYRSAPRSGALGRARPGGDGREGDVTRPPPAPPRPPARARAPAPAAGPAARSAALHFENIVFITLLLRCVFGVRTPSHVCACCSHNHAFCSFRYLKYRAVYARNVVLVLVKRLLE